MAGEGAWESHTRFSEQKSDLYEPVSLCTVRIGCVKVAEEVVVVVIVVVVGVGVGVEVGVGVGAGVVVAAAVQVVEALVKWK